MASVTSVYLNKSSRLEKVKKLSTVSFADPEHYRFRNRGAGGNNLVRGDVT